jgi:LAGLIDADG endonuclease
VGHAFAVTQGARSIECLQMMRRFFGVGEVYQNRRYDNHKEHLYQYCVMKRDDLVQTIIPFFKQYPLRTSKSGDFSKFVECMRLIEAKAHLTREGLIAIAEITETMNHCKPRSEMIRILRDYMPDTDDRVGEDIVRSAWRHAG